MRFVTGTGIRRQTYNQYIGDKALKTIGRAEWNKRVRKALGSLQILLNYDKLYIGGGNARFIAFRLDKNAKIVSNRAGILGGIALWRANGRRGR